MVVVDAHCHASPFYYEPVESALDTMNRNGVDKGVLIPLHIGVYGPLTSYLIESMRRFPGRFSVVATVDTDRPDAPAQLEEWVKQGATGIRLDPAVRSPGSDPLAIWRKAAELGAVVSLALHQRTDEVGSDDFRRLVESFPGLKIVIEHLGGAGHDAAPPHNAFRRVLALAQYPNTYMKVPGLGEICQRAISFRQPSMPFEHIPPLIEMAIAAFGPQRLMWGSDFPHVAEREGYGNCLRLLEQHVQFDSEEDKEWIFGKTAATLFRFGE